MKDLFKKGFYKETWFMWVMLLFFAPFGIFLMYKYNQKLPKKAKMVISIVAVIFMIFIVTSNSENLDSKTNNNNNKVEEKESNKNDDNFFTVDKNQENTNSITADYGTETITKLRELGFTVQEATSIYNIFIKIGISKLSNVQLGAGTGIDNLQAFVGIANNDKKKKFYFTVEKRNMIYAGFLDETLFDIDKGGVLKSINDVHIPKTDIDLDTYSKLQVLSQNLVKQYLKYPSTAKFPIYDGWGVGRRDNNYKVSGKVTAKNGFGVASDMSFSVWLINNNGNFDVEAIVIDDVRVK